MAMKHPFIQILLFLVFTGSNVTAETGDTIRINSFSIIASPSAFLNRYAGAQAGLRYTFHRRWSVFSEYGYIIPRDFAPWPGGDEGGNRYSGFRIKGGVRYQFNRFLFMELIYYHRQILQQVREDFFRFNNSYIEEMDFTIKQKLNGMVLTTGAQFQWSPRWSTEISGGLGYGLRDQYYSELPRDVNMVGWRRAFQLFSPPRFRHQPQLKKPFPLMAVSFRIIYQLF